jgi:hypothetical protein
MLGARKWESRMSGVLVLEGQRRGSNSRRDGREGGWAVRREWFRMRLLQQV